MKYIADPSMHSMPAVAEHPNGKALSFQSLDNQIVTYTTAGRFRQNRKKTFKGHLAAGNACQVRLLLVLIVALDARPDTVTSCCDIQWPWSL